MYDTVYYERYRTKRMMPYLRLIEKNIIYRYFEMNIIALQKNNYIKVNVYKI